MVLESTCTIASISILFCENNLGWMSKQINTMNVCFIN
jgi:hypothetical protein